MFTGTATAQSISLPTSVNQTVSDFNALLRAFDLNTDMQNHYAITADEYATLQEAWHRLPDHAQTQLTDAETGWQDFALMLLYDLYFETPWAEHVNKAAGYGAQGLSLTISRHKNVITVLQARKTLVDLMRQGPSMLHSGTFKLTQRIKAEARTRAGHKALARLNQWEAFINENQPADALEKVKVVSTFFKKRIRETADKNESKGFDYWQSPVESLVRGKGDCDDFAIAHYVSLRLLGIPASQLRVALVDHPDIGGHGVLFYYPKGEVDPWVLDNYSSDRLGRAFGRLQRLSVRMRIDGITPLYSLNENLTGQFIAGEEVILTNNRRAFMPAFATALLNSQRMLPRQSTTLQFAELASIK